MHEINGKSANDIKNLDFVNFNELVNKEFKITYKGNGYNLESLEIVYMEPLK